MTHPLEGHFTAEGSAQLLRHYRYVVERAMRAMSGWIALTPELSAKLLLGRHVWDLAQHCDVFGRRLAELRAQAHQSEPAGPAVGAFMAALEEPEGPDQTAERLTGVYRVLKPHLLAVYREHLARANQVYEPPTRQILARCIEDERRHIAAGEIVLAHVAGGPAQAARAGDWQRRLEGMLGAAGGVSGAGLPACPPSAPVAPLDLADDPREWIRLERVVSAWPLPPGLGGALEAFGRTLLEPDAPGPARWLAPDTRWDERALAALRDGRVVEHRIVAVARVGAQRVVKHRLDGPATTLVLQARWVPLDDGWRVAQLDVASIGVSRIT